VRVKKKCGAEVRCGSAGKPRAWERDRVLNNNQYPVYYLA
jgi:hypothetical protein